jgi:hypothetical protein
MLGFLLGNSGSGGVNLTIAANTSNYDVFSAAGSPSGVVQVTVTVAAGVIVNDATRSGFALKTTAPGVGGGWAPGSTVSIVNQGFIEGFGGNGNSGSGGAAILLGIDTTIDNTNGYIRGGGAGGAIGPDGNGVVTQGGGGGGGGQGNPGGGAGVASSGGGFGVSGTNGTAGSRTARGGGGAGANNGSGSFGGSGGGGGSWGAPGDSSTRSSSSNGFVSTGVPGNAIKLQGHAVTWTGGFNSTQVKGTVA